MSEQTPNSSEDLSGAEPSMEDILASIRKIISDDEPVAMESPEDVPAVSLVETNEADPLDDLMQGIHMDSNDLTSDAVLDAAVVQPDMTTPAAESVDLNIDDVLAGLDDDVLGSEPSEMLVAEVDLDLVERQAPEALHVVADADMSDALDVETLVSTDATLESDGDIPQTDDDILAFLDADIPLAAEPVVSLTQTVTETVEIEVPAEVPEKIAASDDLEMDALLDDILMVPLESETEDAFQNMPIETGFTADPPAAEERSDLDLVKSLMADLADDQGDEDLDALLAIPEVEEEGALRAIEDTLTEAEVDSDAQTDAAVESESESEDDILGDILNMTLEDELKNHPVDAGIEQDAYLESLDAVIGAEQENIAENADIMDAAEDDLPSLSEIAAAAEADALAVETAPLETIQAPQAVAATAGLGAIAGLTALGATALGATPAEAETETAETFSEPEISPELTPTQETSMPVKAVKTDAILDEVTETATAGAFAELNQVVEDKAIFNERGPRIGDLVQEALRPMLKEWLDANLKGIVERAVTKEVKRISSGK